MKKFVLIIAVIILGFLIFGFLFKKDTSVLKNTEEESFYVDNLSLLGTHLNISGCIDKNIEGETSLILKDDKEEILIDSEFNNSDSKTCFKLSNKNNEGINLEKLKEGGYFLLIKEIVDEKNYFYTIENKTNNTSLTYYTITKDDKNNKIEIISDVDQKHDKNYINFKIQNTKLPEDVYDITIDPGHGGNDPGTNYTLDGENYNESDLTLKISLLLKKELEDLGLKVKLTRESDIAVEPYGDNGRAVIPNKVKSKYSISIHLNSAVGTMNYGGVEVYTPNDINYDLAKILANNVGEVVGYSKKPTDKITDGVYFTYFKNSDIEQSKNDMLEEGNKPYDIKLGAPYMYMIREVGGINTKAYIDGRNKDYDINPYYNSIQTAEPYLIELAYMNYRKDLVKLVNSPEEFSLAIANSIREYLDIS